jgi:hypothetical protein
MVILHELSTFPGTIISNSRLNVRFWHKADISRLSFNVRLWGKADIGPKRFNVRF